MLRRLSEQDSQHVSAYLLANPEVNLFIIGDLEAFGYATDIQELWADIDDNGLIRSLLFRFYHHYIFCAQEAFDPEPYIEIIQRDPDFDLLQGDARVVEAFRNRGIAFRQEQRALMASLRTLSPAADGVAISEVKQATLEDLDRILDLRGQIDSLARSTSARESLQRSMENQSSRTFYIEGRDGQMVSAASTAAENSQSAMVVSVCTLPQYRQSGLASRCMAALCRDVLAQGKMLCLFYDNPGAGRIYLRLGFQHIGEWLMLRV